MILGRPLTLKDPVAGKVNNVEPKGLLFTSHVASKANADWEIGSDVSDKTLSSSFRNFLKNYLINKISSPVDIIK